MKLKVLSSTILLLSLFGMGLAHADSNLEFQAGSLDDGAQWTVKQFGDIASYFKRGTSGEVKFSCTLTSLDNSDDSILYAMVYPGKNFPLTQNMPFSLSKGSKTVTWILKDTGTDVGNVRVKLFKGDKNGQANIQCKTVSTAK